MNVAPQESVTQTCNEERNLTAQRVANALTKTRIKRQSSGYTHASRGKVEAVEASLIRAASHLKMVLTETSSLVLWRNVDEPKMQVAFSG